jgi:hypothetical protein
MTLYLIKLTQPLWNMQKVAARQTRMAKMVKIATTNLLNLHQKKRHKTDVSSLFKNTDEDSDDDNDKVFAVNDDDEDDENEGDASQNQKWLVLNYLSKLKNTT